MRRDTFKLLIFAGIVAFAVLYGMELSSKGIEDVNGPWATGSPNVTQESGTDEEWALPNTGPVQTRNLGPAATQKPDDSVPYYGWDDEEEYGIPRNDRKPIVDRFSGKTAEVLHDLSRSGIRIVVSIFDRVTG